MRDWILGWIETLFVALLTALFTLVVWLLTKYTPNLMEIIILYWILDNNYSIFKIQEEFKKQGV